MRLRVMVSVDNMPTVQGVIDYTQPTSEALGEWKVELRDSDHIWFAGQMVTLDIDAGFLAWTGRALPIRLTQPNELSEPSTLTLQGDGDLTLTRHIDIETGEDLLKVNDRG